jgi:hypothetical protein
MAYGYINIPNNYWVRSISSFSSHLHTTITYDNSRIKYVLPNNSLKEHNNA